MHTHAGTLWVITVKNRVEWLHLRVEIHCRIRVYSYQGCKLATTYNVLTAYRHICVT